MAKESTDALLRRSIAVAGVREVRNCLNQLLAEKRPSKSETLTIIANAGVHHLPKQFRRGDVFIASRGSLDFSSQGTIKVQIRNILLRLARKLKSKPYRIVHLIPFGHCVLSMQIKLLVYRVAHIETKDLFYVGGNKYFDYDDNLREMILGARSLRD